MFQQAAPEGVMNTFRGRRDPEARGQIRIVQKRVQQSSNVIVGNGGNNGLQFGPHGFGILPGSGEEIAEVHFLVYDPANFVDGELGPVVVELHEPFDFDEVVALEGLDADLPRRYPTSSNRFRPCDPREPVKKIRFPSALLPHFLGTDQEYGSGNFVRLQLPYEGRFHCVTGTGGTATGVCCTGATAGGGAGLESFGPLT